MQARTLKGRDVPIVAQIIHNSRDEVRQMLHEYGPKLKQLNTMRQAALGADDAGIDSEAMLAADSYEEELKITGGAETVFALLGQVNSGIWPWLADMGQVTVAELDDAPIGDVVDLVNQIVRSEDWPDFLERLQAAATGKPVSISSRRATGGRTNRSKASELAATAD